jgi:DNA-binding response OmpR family regulator
MARILVAEDSPSVRASLGRFLVQAGHEVATAENGLVAISAHRDRPVDLAIVDLVMPEKDGFETISELRTGSPAPMIIATCGDTRLPAEIGLRTALAMGACCALKKPISAARLLFAMREHAGLPPPPGFPDAGEPPGRGPILSAAGTGVPRA